LEVSILGIFLPREIICYPAPHLSAGLRHDKKMKNVLSAALIVVLIMPAMQSCKKGAEDPFISLRSRDSRIQGNWVLVEVNRTRTQTTTNSTTNSTTTVVDTWTEFYDGTDLTYSYFNKIDDGLGNVTDTMYKEVSSYSLEVIINKDNSYSYSESKTEKTECNSGLQDCTPVAVVSPETNEGSDKGTWYWRDSKKNKVAIWLSAGSGNGTAWDYFSGDLLQLKNSEIIIEFADSTVTKATGPGFSNEILDVETWTSTWVKNKNK